jgi:putative acetyltransferase
MIGEILAAYGLALDPESTDADLEDVESFYGAGGGCFEVLVDSEDRVVGSYGMHVQARSGGGAILTIELRKMYLREELRGLGWGRRMLDRALRFAREVGAERVVLETATRLDAALGLYRAYGFAETGESPPAARCDLSLSLELEPGGGS